MASSGSGQRFPTPGIFSISNLFPLKARRFWPGNWSTMVPQITLKTCAVRTSLVPIFGVAGLCPYGPMMFIALKRNQYPLNGADIFGVEATEYNRVRG